jgi:hypothetical protein
VNRRCVLQVGGGMVHQDAAVGWVAFSLALQIAIRSGMSTKSVTLLMASSQKSGLASTCCNAT